MSTDRERVIREGHEAALLQGNQLLTDVLAEIESDAVELAVSASPTDHDLRAAAMAEIRAARSLASKLALRAAEAIATNKPRGGVA